MSIAVFIAVVALLVWSVWPKQRRTEAVRVDADDRRWMTPGMYGSNAEGGLAHSYVETHDSSGPVVLLIGAPGSRTADWSAVQALLERNGIASVAVVPLSRSWRESLSAGARTVAAIATQRHRPIGVLTFASALDSVLTAEFDSAIRNGHLVAFAPNPPRLRPLSRLTSRLPKWVRPEADSLDTRLLRWTGPVLVVRIQDDSRFGQVAAQRLAGSARGGSTVVVHSARKFDGAPRHPADDEWRDVINHLFGSEQRELMVVPRDSTRPDPTSATPVQPSGTLRPPPR